MITSETTIRVRYGETDQMGYSYYGNYALYYEVGRTDMLRQLKFSYRKLEEEGYILPVKSLQIHYIKPAKYDDTITVKTFLKKIPSAKIKFDYEVYNKEKELINHGTTELVFVDRESKKVTKPPVFFIDKVKQYFPAEN